MSLSKDICLKKIEQNMLKVPKGIFSMGNDGFEDYEYMGERPIHKVEMDSFEISTIPITMEMYNLFDANYIVVSKEFPVVNITWDDALDFCTWLGLDLPTEAEWEYACKMGQQLKPNSDKDLANTAWYSHNSESKLHRVSTLNPDGLGLYDMLGNVWEWCKDSYNKDFYVISEVKNPICLETGKYKVCRGGSFYSFSEMCRSNFRWKEPKDFWAKDLGFRVVRRIPL